MSINKVILIDGDKNGFNTPNAIIKFKNSVKKIGIMILLI
jgi:hypothetical protein